MSSTRYAASGEPLSQERYMSSPEFAELQGVTALAVAARAAIVTDPAARELLWFLQGLSLQPGGLRKVAAELMAMFPERVRKPKANPLDLRDVPPLHNFLVDLLINPRLEIGNETVRPGERLRVREEFQNVRDFEFSQADAPQLRDIIGALTEYKQRHEQEAVSNFALTQNAKRVWDTLEFSARAKRVVLIEGREGRGKTEAASAWCLGNLGRARFVTLKAITNKTTVFREIAKALGVARGPGRKSTEMQGAIEYVLERSKIMLVIDEAHFLMSNSQRVYVRPELVDWIGTLSNQVIPVSLVTTPQFMQGIQRARVQVGWNHNQFTRRVKRYVKLTDHTSPADIEKVARHLLPGASDPLIELALGFTKILGRDLSGLGDLVEEARLIAEEKGRGKISFEDLKTAMRDRVAPSAAFFTEANKAADHTRRRSRRSTGAIPLEDVANVVEAAAEEEQPGGLSRERNSPAPVEQDRRGSPRVDILVSKIS